MRRGRKAQRQNHPPTSWPSRAAVRAATRIIVARAARRSTGSSVATAALTFTATARHTARSRSLRPARSTTRAGSRPTCISGAPKNCPGSIFPRASPRHPRTRAEKDSNSPASSQRNPSTRLHRRPRCPRQDPRNSVHSERKTPDSPVMAHPGSGAMSAFSSLSELKQTYLGHRISVAIDP
jgi:hypothetical protein